MTWHSKNFLDFEDFTWVLKLKEQGHHHTEKGKFLMDSFLEQINNRLSTTVKPRVNRGLFISQDEREENLNYIRKKKWLTYRKQVAIEIVDVKGNVVNTYQSISAVMDFLGVSRYIILKRLEDGESITRIKENRLIYIQEVDV